MVFILYNFVEYAIFDIKRVSNIEWFACQSLQLKSLFTSKCVARTIPKASLIFLSLMH